MLVRTIVERNARYFPDDEAIVEQGGRSLTWSELNARSNQLAAGLRDLGLGKGDRLAMYSLNCAEYMEFFFACAKTGIVGQALNARLTPGELVPYVDDIGPRGLIVGRGFDELADELVGRTSSVETLVGLETDGAADHHHYEELLASQPIQDPATDVVESDPYQICATSGTTGRMKGAVHTQGSAMAAILTYVMELPTRQRDTNLQNIPFFFNSGGPASISPVLVRGGRSILPEAFGLREFLEAIPTYRVTHTTLVPTMLNMVLAEDGVDEVDVSSLRVLIMGGSPLSRDLLVRGRKIFGDVFHPFYGMAESYSTGGFLRREDQKPQGDEHEVARLSSAGRSMVTTQVRVAGDDGEEVAWDGETPGEVWVGGDTLFSGYFGLEEETAMAREGRWFKSGDIAVVDDEGFFTIVDRTKDIIISGGINVFSREVEDALVDHPGIDQVAVIGVPDDRWGERVHAVVVALDDTLDEDAVRAHAAERLADYKRPKSVEFRDELPISATGKVLKKNLRAPYWEGTGRRV